MTGIPYPYGIDTLPINRNRNVKHKTETETERTPKKKEKKKFETSAFGGASRGLFSFHFRENPEALCMWKRRRGFGGRQTGSVGARHGRRS